MAEIFLSDSAKAQVLNSVLHAERNYIERVQDNAERERDGTIKEKHRALEQRYRDIYAAMYRLCCNLGLGELYRDWRDERTYEEDD